MQVHWCFPLKTWSWSLLIWKPIQDTVLCLLSGKLLALVIRFKRATSHLQFKTEKEKGRTKLRISKCPSPNIMGISNDTSFKHIFIPNMFQLHEKRYRSMAYWSNVKWGTWILRVCKSNFQRGWRQGENERCPFSEWFLRGLIVQPAHCNLSSRAQGCWRDEI